MSVDGNTCAKGDLLTPQGDGVGACRGANLDVDVAVIAKMNKVLPAGRTEHVSLWRHSLNRVYALREYLADAEAAQSEQKGSAFRFGCIHSNTLWSLMARSS